MPLRGRTHPRKSKPLFISGHLLTALKPDHQRPRRRCKSTPGGFVGCHDAPLIEQSASAYFGADSPVVAASGCMIFITKEVGLSFGLKGPGTLFLTSGRLLRNAAIARLSSLVRFAY